MLGIENGRHGIAGTLAWPGRSCKTMGRRLPVDWDGDEAGGGYMTKDVADLFDEARQLT
jgi:hypothetical protein